MIKELRQITTNGWIKLPLIEVYVRKSSRVLGLQRQNTIELANWITDDMPAFIQAVHDIECYAAGIHHTVFVENVLQSEYCSFFVKRGYTEIPGGFGTRSFYLERRL